jgi:hypothetical protein
MKKRRNYSPEDEDELSRDSSKIPSKLPLVTQVSNSTSQSTTLPNISPNSAPSIMSILKKKLKSEDPQSGLTLGERRLIQFSNSQNSSELRQRCSFDEQNDSTPKQES